MLKKLCCISILILQSVLLFAQLPVQDEAFNSCHCPGMVKGHKGKLYFSFGYNLDWFTRSNITFKDSKTDDYNFTLYSVKAVDRPALKYIFQEDITLPQYSYRIGYFFNDKRDMGIEINYDHVKYLMLNDQRVHIKGEIHGTTVDGDTLLYDKFIQYEHTNGANYFMVNLARRFNFLHSKNELHWLSGVVRAGAGPVIPRTATRLWGIHARDDVYHVAGFVAGVDLGVRYDFLKNFYFETNGKGAYADYTNVLLYGEGRAHQHWFSFEYIFTIGFQFAAKLF